MATRKPALELKPEALITCCRCCGRRTLSAAASLTTLRHCSLQEVEQTARTLEEEGQQLRGVHLEATAMDVTECYGEGVSLEDVPTRSVAMWLRMLRKSQPHCGGCIRYSTGCDPRLNGKQSRWFAERLGKFIGTMGGTQPQSEVNAQSFDFAGHRKRRLSPEEVKADE